MESHILLWLREAYRELVAQLYAVDSFFLQANEGEGRRSVSIVAQPELALLVRTPHPRHALLICDADVRLADRACDSLSGHPADAIGSWVVSEGSTAPDEELTVDGNGSRVLLAGDRGYLGQTIDLNWLVDVGGLVA